MTTERINEKLNDIAFGTTLGIWCVMGGLVVYLGKKIADFIYDATIGKFRSDIGLIVEEKITTLRHEVEKYKEEVIGYREQHHGTLKKNEGVLLEMLDINRETLKQLEEYKKYLNSKRND